MEGFFLFSYLLEIARIVGGGLGAAQQFREGKRLGGTGLLIAAIAAALSFSLTIIHQPSP